MSDLARHLDDLNEEFLRLHTSKEQAFWDTRMGLADRHRELAEGDLALRDFLGDPARLAELRRRKERGDADPAQDVVLDGWILTLERNQVEDAEARDLLGELTNRETELQKARGGMALGYVAEDGTTEPAGSVALGNSVRTDPDPARRRAAFEGLRSIETFALDQGFAEIVKLRNRFARRLGFGDFYEYKVHWAEGFDKKTLFVMLDDLEERTREPARRGLEQLRREAGDDALLPWNVAFHTGGGDLQKERDAYFRFEDAVERWARSFAALGVRFRDASVTLDLIDRKGKYENGFMHGPVPAFRRRGTWQPAEINFTANALPGRVGAGFRAAQTLFHEGGHAAHFANVTMDAPCFSQEYAPTSVALAETQSMFFDRMLGDADWQTRYALNEAGESVPFPLIEAAIRQTQPHAAYSLRNMLVVCYAEKSLYEMEDAELTPDSILAAFRDAERRLTLLDGGCSRPTLAVPHLLSREASAYYHGYVLAQMAVYQTRDFFGKKYGHLLDNPDIGREMSATYWAPGNSRGFLELVEAMTGTPLRSDALVDDVSLPAEEAVARAKAMVERLPEIPEAKGDPDLELRLRVIHGSETVVENGKTPLQVADEFRRWVRERWPSEPAGASA